MSSIANSKLMIFLASSLIGEGATCGRRRVVVSERHDAIVALTPLRSSAAGALPAPAPPAGCGVSDMLAIRQGSASASGGQSSLAQPTSAS